jgi:hypothetical protein
MIISNERDYILCDFLANESWDEMLKCFNCRSDSDGIRLKFLFT